MYADRIEAGSKRSIKDRLDGNMDVDPGRTRSANGKRQCQSDDKWNHDLYEDQKGPQVSKARVGVEDLRAQLQKKIAQHAYQGRKDSGVQSLPEKKLSVTGVLSLPEKKLSGTMQPPPKDTAPLKAKTVPEVAKPAKKRVIPADEIAVDTKKVSASTSSQKKSKKKSDFSVDSLLKALGLEKYLITFQAEEVDMAALRHMTEDDLRTLGIPMGPRKKILLALDSKA